ncbi:MAG TPA: methyltransferase domain-containing protein [Terracidiphilus sp.]|nr:methyltransferase domain-containing protein [Terracidiphilus sp.]
MVRKQLIFIDGVSDWSQLRKVRPHRRDFGSGRGECIDRFYIETFLAEHRESIRGRVAEIGSDHYTRLFGGPGVEHSDVIDVDERNHRRTITLDLTSTYAAPSDAFDCILCPQTLFEIYDYASALDSLYKTLRPGGVLLSTLPGISQSVQGNMLGGAGSDYWRFTSRSAARVFGEVFGPENVDVQAYGNVLSSVAFLHGLVQGEVVPEELEYHDPDYELTIAIKAVKRTSSPDAQGVASASASADTISSSLKRIKHLVPAPARQWLNIRREEVERKMLLLDRVTDWSVLRRIHPYRPRLGERRGECVDRFYIDQFLAQNQDSIRGRVAEFQDSGYTLRYGGGRVTQTEIIDIDHRNTQRTVTLDLVETDSAPQSIFECIICTQTLFLIFDFKAAIRTIFKMLSIGGVVLATVPGICQLLPPDMAGGADGEWWRFTSNSARESFAEIFGKENVEVTTYGNVLTSVASLHGLVQEELTPAELAYHDPEYEFIIGVKATKRA